MNKTFNCRWAPGVQGLKLALKAQQLRMVYERVRNNNPLHIFCTTTQSNYKAIFHPDNTARPDLFGQLYASSSAQTLSPKKSEDWGCLLLPQLWLHALVNC
jgi:hypothetical protein